MEIGIYITANIIYLGWELCLGDRVVCSSLLGKRVVTTPFAEHNFSSVLWPLAGGSAQLSVGRKFQLCLGASVQHVPGRECPTECWEKVSAVPQGVSAQLCLGGSAQLGVGGRIQLCLGRRAQLCLGGRTLERRTTVLCPMGCAWVHSVSWPEDKVSVGVITSVGFGWIICTAVP